MLTVTLYMAKNVWSFATIMENLKLGDYWEEFWAAFKGGFKQSLMQYPDFNHIW